MMWIPLAVCALLFFAYARSVGTKHVSAEECLFCLRDGAETPDQSSTGATTLPAADPDLPLSA